MRGRPGCARGGFGCLHRPRKWKHYGRQIESGAAGGWAPTHGLNEDELQRAERLLREREPLAAELRAARSSAIYAGRFVQPEPTHLLARGDPLARIRRSENGMGRDDWLERSREMQNIRPQAAPLNGVVHSRLRNTEVTFTMFSSGKMGKR